jgi:hypothetical protein
MNFVRDFWEALLISFLYFLFLLIFAYCHRIYKKNKNFCLNKSFF